MASGKPAEMTLSDEQVAIQQDYDNLPYENYPFPLSHPQHQSVLARLFGMRPAEVEKCRVLELGCGSGGNLIPLAAQFPKSQFFGIDLSAGQVELANQTIKQLKLKNIKVEHKDILELDGRIRKFDFIICHAVYSYVPEQVQEKILQVAKRYLNENGIVYVSYNTYPGWHMRESVRDMMRYHTANIDDMQEKINQSRALLKFLADSVNASSGMYGQYLKSELALLSRVNNAQLFHEYLERHNKPLYFHQFCKAADDAGLQYLAESELHGMYAGNFSPDVAATLSQLNDNLINQEQYMDFLRNRSFRATLLCHKEVELNRTLDASLLEDMHFSAVPMWRVTDKESGQLREGVFVTQMGMQVQITGKLTMAALNILNTRWPATLTFDELYNKAVEQVGEAGDGQRAVLADDMLRLYIARAIELHTVASGFQIEVSDKPRTSELARLQAADSYAITNMRHEVAHINDPTRRLLQLLDGQSDHEALLEHMLKMVDSNDLVLKEDEVEITDKERQRQYIGQFLQQILAELARRALLIA